MAAITFAGENLIASLQSQGKTLVTDKLILANIPGLDASASVDRSQGLPSAEQIVSQEAITQAGVVESKTIVYSQVLGSDLGTWSFNWLGLYCSEHDTVLAVAYESLQEKRATVGEVIGNVITKNFGVEFNGATSLTGINISAESWQVDFSARLLDMDEIQREAMALVYGDITALNSSFNVFYSAGKYFVTKGKGIVNGLLVELEADLEITPGYFPCYVHVDVWQEKSMAGISNKVNFVLLPAEDHANYMNGPTQVYRSFYVDILSAGVVGVQQQTQTTSFELYHQGNMPEGSTLKKGIVKFADDAASTSENEAINAKIFSEHSHTIRELQTERIFSNMNPIYEVNLNDLESLPDVCLIQVGWVEYNGTGTTYSSMVYRKTNSDQISQVVAATYQTVTALQVNSVNRMTVYRNTNEGGDALKIRYIDIIK